MTIRNAVTPYLVTFAGITALLALAEKEFGLPPRWIGWIFVVLSIAIYLLIGVTTRTLEGNQFYVARRSIPAAFHGMARASQWLSAASFLSLAGVLAATGWGVAYAVGWAGGYLLFAIVLGPYLRQFGRYSIPTFLEARYGGGAARMIGVIAVIAVSFIYLVAQLTGVGIVASRLLGIAFPSAVLAGLLVVVVCCAVGGMRSTWAHVTQYLVVVLAYLVPLVVLSVKLYGNPVPPLVEAQLIRSNTARIAQLAKDPGEIATRSAWAAEERALVGRIADPATPRPESSRLAAAQRTAAVQARSPGSDGALDDGRLARPHGNALWNFLALVLCLVVGTAALPHIITHDDATTSVRQVRTSVAWSLGFIVLLYVAATGYASFARHALLTTLVGSSVAAPPSFVAAWSPTGLFTIVDKLGDGVVQLADVVVGSTDFVVLALPEMAGLPFVITGIVMAGGLIAAVATAENLLLTIANAASHDVYYRTVPRASLIQRLTIARIVLVATGLAAAYVATWRWGIIVEVVACACSLAGAAFFPSLVMGIWWRRANRIGAVAAMVVGPGVALAYMIASAFYGVSWFGTATVAAGIFGIPAGLVTLWAVSLVTHAPPAAIQDLVIGMRYPAAGAAARPAPGGPSGRVALR